MSMTSQQYAGLAQKSYSNEYRPGIYPPDEAPRFEYEGVIYKVLEHASNPFNGYQGTIFQRVDTGEIIVAHRGTEPDQGLGQILRDGALTDGAMAAARINPQSADAIALTKRALDYAEQQGRQPGGQTPEVTVTGHSLGGTHAQITAHQFGLRGETFNAYGAASLSYRIPRGGDPVINHVMAGDFVSAASPHFGQVRVYASADEIATLHAAGYANDRNPLDPRAPGVAAGALAGSHSLDHFLNTDGEGRPDRSLLAEPAARQLSQVFEPMVDKYRGDIALGRAAATVAFRGPAGTTRDLIDELRGPLPAGEPAARAEQAAAVQAERAQLLADDQAQHEEQRRQAYRKRFPSLDPTAPPPDLLRRPQTQDAVEDIRPYRLPEYPGTLPSTRAAPDAGEPGHGERSPSSDIRLPRDEQAQAMPVPVPEHLRDFRHPEHPLHSRYMRFLAGLEKADAGYFQNKSNLPPYTPEQRERLAAGLTATPGITTFAEVGQFHLDQNGTLWASNLPPNVLDTPGWVSVPLDQTLAQTPDALAERWRQQNVPAPTATMAQAQSLDPRQLPATDLRHPEHSHHGLFAQTRATLSNEYARWGLQPDATRLDREAACCVVAARDERMSQVGGLQLSFPDGRLERPAVLLRQNPADEFSGRASVSAAELAQAPEVAHSSLRLQAVEQQLALLTQQDLQRSQERETQPSARMA